MEIKASIRNEYRAARERAIAEADARKEAVYGAQPRLREIEAEQLALAFGLGPKLLQGGDREAIRAETEKAIAALDGEAARLLADMGMTPDTLKPDFRCKICEDTGFIKPGKRMCACLRQRLLQEEYASSGFAQNAGFEQFDTSIYADETQLRRSLKAKAICESYAQDLAYNGAKGLLIMGDVGLGKTYLADCIGKRAIANGYSVKKYTAYNLVDRILRSIQERSSDMSAAALAEADLLIIDDLGTEPSIRNVTYEMLFSAINERQNAGKATVIATNLNKAQLLDDYGERLFSRITSPRLFSVIELKGESLR